MSLYMTRAKLSNEAFKGYVSNPQDREAAIKALMSAVAQCTKCILASVRPK